MTRALGPPAASSFPRWLGGLLVAGLVVALLSLYVPGDWRSADVGLYHVYALRFWGNLVHPMLPTEYPPLSVFVFSLTLAGPGAWFADVFAFWMGVIALLGYVAFRRWGTARQAAAYGIYVLAAGVATLLFRYDLVPALLTVGALWLIQRRHFGPVYPALAAATLLKLYPIVLLPVVAIAHWRARGERAPLLAGVTGCIAIVVAGFVAAALVDPAHGLGALTYDLQRPTEVESVPATLLWLGSLAGVPTHPIVSFGSANLTSDLSTAVNAAADVILGLGLLWVYWRMLRGHLTPNQAALATVLLLLCTSKVLSAQYLLWVAPLLAATVGFQLRWLFVCLLTALIFPTLFEVGIDITTGHVAYSGWVLAGVGVRNALLVICTARFLISPGADSTGEPAAPLVSRPPRPQLA